jgi:Ulp1 family protease
MNTTHKYAGKKRHHHHQNRRQTKRMVCSPVVKKISVKNSCYTPKILFMIRDAYNKDHAKQEDKIVETDPTKLWKILNTRFVQCQKEDCWLNEIKDANLKKRIDRYIFAPDKPYEWKSNPNEWLSNFDIMNVLEQYEITYKQFEFIGPTPIDFDKVISGKCVYNELCRFQLSEQIKKGKTKIGVIFNLSPHTSGGSHWVSLFIDVQHRMIFYFDSAGESIPKEIDDFVKRVQTQVMEHHKHEYTFYENHPKTHQMGNTECGVYSLFFIITMLTSRSRFKKGLMSMKQKIQLFKEHTIKDEYIEKYRNVYFND